MKFSIIAFLIIFLFAGEISALSISSVNDAETAKEDCRDRKNFEFSKTILIKGIEFEDGFLKMPLDGCKKKKYSNIKILSKDFYQKILDCFKIQKCVISAAKKDISLKVEKIFSLKSPLRIANANVSFDNELIVTFGIVKDKDKKDEIWISYPEAFEIKDEAFKDKLEKLIKKESRKSITPRNSSNSRDHHAMPHGVEVLEIFQIPKGNIQR
ncbi:MAG: hypothetical protein L6420_03420 [Elusimicrobia bacterium]|nr:hypothetical protein [Elusimicrobiota bacterium]